MVFFWLLFTFIWPNCIIFALKNGQTEIFDLIILYNLSVRRY